VNVYINKHAHINIYREVSQRDRYTYGLLIGTWTMENQAFVAPLYIDVQYIYILYILVGGFNPSEKY